MIGVFGATGFIGRNVVQYLSAQGLKVRAISWAFKDDFLANLPGVECVVSDMRDTTSVSIAMDGLDGAVQLVSTTGPGFGNSNLVKDIENSLIPQIRFLEMCQLRGVGKVIFASSGGTVYGKPTEVPIKESHSTRPVSSYGIIKLTTEKYLELFAQNYALPYVVLRIANPYGPHQTFRNGQGLIANIISHCKDGTPIPVFGEGLAQRDYIYVEDVCRAFHMALVNPNANGAAINIGSGQGISILQVLAQMEALLGQPLPRHYVPARSTDVDISVLDIALADKILGWRPQVNFDEGLRRTLAFAGMLGN